jgi:hypothetical protein
MVMNSVTCSCVLSMPLHSVWRGVISIESSQRTHCRRVEHPRLPTYPSAAYAKQRCDCSHGPGQRSATRLGGTNGFYMPAATDPASLNALHDGILSNWSVPADYKD